MSRVLDDLNQKYTGRITTEKINVMEKPELARKHNVRYVPHLLFVDADGNVLKESVGYMPLDEVVKTFKAAGIVLE